LAYARTSGLLANQGARRALAMAVDRDALAASLGVPNLAPRTALLPTGLEELAQPALPDWDALALPARQARARALIAAAAGREPPQLRVAMPEGPGYRLVFAHLQRDWRAIGVEVQAVGPQERADLRLIDETAPALLASWYLRRFTCEASAVCSQAADAALEEARAAPNLLDRQARLAEAERLLTELSPFIPLTSPVRWSLVAPRLTGFQPNPFAVHFPGSLVASQR
jgi:peptide/nickel transport system substrate-binding protein